jgi:hypothetical protein
MGPVTTVAAGFAAALGAMALYQAVMRRARAARKTVENLKAPRGAVLDFELDRASGVYRAK